MTDKIEEISKKLNDDLNENRENPKKIEDQSILMFHLAELSKASKQIRGLPERVEKKGRFHNLLVLDSNTPYLLPNFLLGPENEKSAFFRLTNLQLSLLTPRIRLYKIVYNASSEKEIEIEIPFDDVANKNDLDRIFLNSSGRGTGAGIKNFIWKTMATNQANLSQFSATITLFVQNIEEMTKIRNSIDDNGNIVDVTLLDLLYQKPSLRGGVNEGTNVYDPKYFGIKMEVGWFLNKNNINVVNTFLNDSKKYNEDGKKALEAAEEQIQTFYMTLISHSFNILEDGSMELTIEYICTAESEASDMIKANILSLSDPIHKQISDINKRLKKIEAGIAHQNTLLKTLDKQDEFVLSVSPDPSAAGFQSRTERNALSQQPEAQARKREIDEENNLHIQVIEQLKQKYGELEQQRRNIPRGYRIERFKSITEKLLKAGLIRGICKTKKEMNAFVDLAYLTVETLDETKFFKKTVNEISSANAKEVKENNMTQKAWDQARETKEHSESKDTIDSDLQVLGSQNLTEERGIFCDEKDSHQINFFYLGDLIDTLLEDLFISNKEENNFITKTTRILLGSITYYDFGSLVADGIITRKQGLQDRDRETVRIYRGAKTIVNIADIPISLNEFITWFVNEYADRENISFLSFAKEMINNFLVGVFNGDFFTFAPSQQILVEMFPFSIPQNERNEVLFRQIINRDTNVGQTFRFEVNSSLKPFSAIQRNQAGAQKQNYILFYGSNQPPYEKTGDEEKDLKDKIYHLYIGEQRSIIKKINFRREDSPYVRENNIQLANPEKQQSGVFIREVYNVSLEMIGNFLFMPGQQVYIHPTYPGQLGQNERENLFRKLGMGRIF